MLQLIYRTSGYLLSKTLLYFFRDNALASWLRFIDSFENLNSKGRKRTLLLNWPRNITGEIQLDICHERVLYLVTEQDDLKYLVRNKLRGWEDESREMFARIAHESKVVLDIGAYTGIY